MLAMLSGLGSHWQRARSLRLNVRPDFEEEFPYRETNSASDNSHFVQGELLER